MVRKGLPFQHDMGCTFSWRQHKHWASHMPLLVGSKASDDKLTVSLTKT